MSYFYDLIFFSKFIFKTYFSHEVILLCNAKISMKILYYALVPFLNFLELVSKALIWVGGLYEIRWIPVPPSIHRSIVKREIFRSW